MPSHKRRFYAAAPVALAPYLLAELTDLGASKARIQGAGVAFEGAIEVAYRACLWSRVASRVLLELARFPAVDGDALYTGARRIQWHALMDLDTRFAIAASTQNARITHSHFAALRLKDALVDHFRERFAKRPTVDVRQPDLRFDLHLRGGEARVSLDLSGQPLHQRGYRQQGGRAPLRETLAAGLLYFANWPQRAKHGQALIDPMCGSGTVLIEAALMAAHRAPGLTRTRFGFEAWREHDETLWQKLLSQARQRSARDTPRRSPIMGFDIDPQSIEFARANAERASVSEWLTFEQQALDDTPHLAVHNAVVVCNPPYGQRLATANEDYASVVREHYPTSDVIVLQANQQANEVHVDDTNEHHESTSREVFNGAIPCRMRWFKPIDDEAPNRPVDTGALTNRLRKRFQHLQRWARRNQVHCWRLYDADLPEFSFAADIYTSTQQWLHVAEYAPPTDISPSLSRRRLEAAMDVLEKVTQIERERIVIKRRQRQRFKQQYQAQSQATRSSHQPIVVEEDGCRVEVDLHRYIDTGLFLDHRPTRRWIRQHAPGKRFLNLFAYTAVASVQAAAGGARSSLSLDLSPHYTKWGCHNLAMNGFQPPQHRCMQVDCLRWLEQPNDAEKFDLIFLDPPTFSNSKRMNKTLDVQRDHVRLIEQAMTRLDDGGTLIFSCNRRGFKLDANALAHFRITDVTARSLDVDFSRQRPPHYCYHMQRID